MMTIYDRIKEKRLELGLTQQDLADKVGYTGKSMVAKVEKGQVDLPTTMVQKFANALETTPSYLMGWDDELDYYSLSKEDEKFLNLIHSLNLSEEQKQQVMVYAKAIKQIEQDEKNKHSD